MSKAERYIELVSDENGYLCDQHALKAVEIEREETIKEVCEWIEKNVYSYTWCEFQQHERGVETGKLIKDLKKHLEGKK